MITLKTKEKEMLVKQNVAQMMILLTRVKSTNNDTINKSKNNLYMDDSDCEGILM